MKTLEECKAYSKTFELGDWVQCIDGPDPELFRNLTDSTERGAGWRHGFKFKIGRFSNSSGLPIVWPDSPNELNVTDGIYIPFISKNGEWDV